MNDASSEQTDATQAADTAADLAADEGDAPAQVEQKATSAARVAAPKLSKAEHSAIGNAAAAATIAALREEGALVSEEEHLAGAGAGAGAPEQGPPPAPAPAPVEQQSPPQKRNFAQRFLKD